MVGAGNSGAEIAIELAPHHKTWLSGPDTGQEPARAGSRLDRPRRKSSRSPDHAPHVARGDAVDSHDRAWTEAPRPLYRPPSWHPTGAGAAKGFCPGRHRTSAASDRREEWISRPGEWKGPRRGERRLVHWIRTPLRLDRSRAANPRWPSHSRPGHCRVLPGSLLRRAPLPLLTELGTVGRCGTRCQAHWRPHRFYPARKKGAIRGPERAEVRRHTESSCRTASSLTACDVVSHQLRGLGDTRFHVDPLPFILNRSGVARHASTRLRRAISRHNIEQCIESTAPWGWLASCLY